MSDPTTRPRARARFLGGLFLVVLVGAAVRVPGVAEEPLWHDEAMTANWTTGSLDALADRLRRDVQLPLYYLAEWAFLAAWPGQGVGHGLLRVPPIAFDLLSIALLGLLVARACSPRAGLIAAFLFALDPIAVHYAREVRPYSLLVLLVIVASASSLALATRVTVLRVVALAACAAAIYYTHGVAPFLLLPLFAAPVVRAARARDLRTATAFVGAAGLAGAAAVPWLRIGLHQATGIGRSYTWADAHWQEIFPWQPLASVAALSPGGTAPVENIVRTFPPAAWLAAAACLVLAGVALQARRSWRVPTAAVDWATCLVGALLTLFVAAWIIAPVHVVGRTDVGVLPWLLALTAAGIDATAVALGRRFSRASPAHSAAAPRRRENVVVAATLVVVVLLAAPGLVKEHLGNGRLADAVVARAVDVHVADGDVLVFAGTYLPTLRWYLPRWGREVELVGFPESREAVLWVDWSAHPPEVLAEQAERVADATLSEARRRGVGLWLLVDPREEHLALIAAYRERADVSVAEELASGEALLRVSPRRR